MGEETDRSRPEGGLALATGAVGLVVFAGALTAGLYISLPAIEEAAEFESWWAVVAELLVPAILGIAGIAVAVVTGNATVKATSIASAAAEAERKRAEREDARLIAAEKTAYEHRLDDAMARAFEKIEEYIDLTMKVAVNTQIKARGLPTEGPTWANWIAPVVALQRCRIAADAEDQKVLGAAVEFLRAIANAEVEKRPLHCAALIGELTAWRAKIRPRESIITAVGEEIRQLHEAFAEREAAQERSDDLWMI